MTSNLFLFGNNSPKDLAFIKSETGGADDLEARQLRSLRCGQTYVLSPDCHDATFHSPHLINLRPTLLRAGGETVRAR